MMVRRWLLAGGGVISTLLLLLALTLLFLPSRELVGVVQRAMARQGLTLEVGTVGKAFPLGLTARQVLVSSERGPIIVADRLTCRLDGRGRP